MTDATIGRRRALTGVLVALVGLAVLALSIRVAGQRTYDLLIRGGMVVDGMGTPAYAADVAIRGDRIVRISTTPIPTTAAADVIDAEGLVVSPGFIDSHAHVQTALDDRPLAENFIRQGITTILASLHSGDQPYPLGDYMDSLETAPNVGFFAGHSWARRRVMGMADRAPTDAELEEMRALVREAMQDGALGLSTGLRYSPASYAETEEVTELARVASRWGGIYVSHMRDEGPGLIEAVAELIRIAEAADIPSQINHHKAAGAGQWGWTERTLAMIDSARAAGIDVKHDVYPYTASSTGSSVLFPAWALAGGRDSLAARLSDPETRERVLAGIREILERERSGDDLSRIQFRTVPSMPEYDGRTLADLARERGLPVDVETGAELVAELELAGGFSAIYHIMDEADVIRILRHPWAMIETDGDLVDFGEGHPHPRSYGAFPRVFARYVRELDVLTLENAVERMTALPASQIGEKDLGRLEEGAFADITVFDPETIADRATFEEPHRYPVGIPHVIVNGVPVLRDGEMTGALPGRVIRGPVLPDRVRG